MHDFGDGWPDRPGGDRRFHDLRTLTAQHKAREEAFPSFKSQLAQHNVGMANAQAQSARRLGAVHLARIGLLTGACVVGTFVLFSVAQLVFHWSPHPDAVLKFTVAGSTAAAVVEVPYIGAAVREVGWRGLFRRSVIDDRERALVAEVTKTIDENAQTTIEEVLTEAAQFFTEQVGIERIKENAGETIYRERPGIYPIILPINVDNNTPIQAISALFLTLTDLAIYRQDVLLAGGQLASDHALELDPPPERARAFVDMFRELQSTQEMFGVLDAPALPSYERKRTIDDRATTFDLHRSIADPPTPG